MDSPSSVAVYEHECRQSLNAMRCAVEVMARRPGRDRGVWARQIVERQLDVIERLLDELKAADGSQELFPRRSDCRVLVEAALAPFAARAAERHISLITCLPAEDIHAMVDRVRLTQIVANLMENALRHSNSGGRVWVLLGERDGRVELRIRDEGHGIEPHRLERIFDAGFRDMAGRPGQCGLGLAIVRRWVHAHAGNIHARSDGPGTGAEFVVTIPLGFSGPTDAVNVPQ